MYSKVKSLGISGMEAFAVTVECDISSGLPRFDVVGLPDTVVKESRERVRSTIKNCKLEFPLSRITVNIAPADIKKEGALYDLPVLIAILKSSGQIKEAIRAKCFSFTVFGTDLREWWLKASEQIRFISGLHLFV
jgi:magnesium chelatase family protein